MEGRSSHLHHPGMVRVRSGNGGVPAVLIRDLSPTGYSRVITGLQGNYQTLLLEAYFSRLLR